MTDPAWALACALYDAEHSTRLSEDPDAQPRYRARARALLVVYTMYRPKRERVAISRAIRK